MSYECQNPEENICECGNKATVRTGGRQIICERCHGIEESGICNQTRCGFPEPELALPDEFLPTHKGLGCKRKRYLVERKA